MTNLKSSLLSNFKRNSCHYKVPLFSSLTMKILSRNMRGIFGRHLLSQLGVIIREHLPDIVAVLETHTRQQNAQRSMRRISRQYPMHEVMHGNRHKGVICLFWNPQKVSLSIIEKLEQCINMHPKLHEWGRSHRTLP